MTERQPRADRPGGSGLACREVRPGHLSLAVPCSHPGCGRQAALVELIASGTPHPDDAFLLRDVLEGGATGAMGQFILKDFTAPSFPNFSMPLSAAEFAEAASAVRAADLVALGALREGYVPFLCTRCELPYCGPHLDLQMFWDWGPDYWTGTCPRGHHHFIDH